MFFDGGPGRALVCLLAAASVVSQVSAASATGTAARSQIVEDLYDAHFVSSERGWVVGVFGAVYETVDGGKVWTQQDTPTQQHLYSVTFTDESRGWAVGRSGEIIHTTDGGKTWARQKSGTEKHLFKVAFPSPETGWVVGDWGVVLHTTDGGRTWQDRSLERDQIVYSIAFSDPQHGWMAGEFGAIRRTTDGGKTWEEKRTGTDKTFFGIATTSADEAWAVGIDGLVVRTRDGGETWEIQHGEAEMASFENIGFLELLRNPGLYEIKIAGDTGYIVGDTGNVLVTLDGGETWKTELLPSEWRLSWIRGLSVLPSGWGMIVGAEGLTFIVEGEKMRFSQSAS